jgi:hypothetical protein
MYDFTGELMSLNIICEKNVNMKLDEIELNSNLIKFLSFIKK